jgi:hypothetical protein
MIRLLEPMIGCHHPIIASGATPIGSADHAPDIKLVKSRISDKSKILDALEEKFEPILELQKFDYSLRGYSHR